MVDRDDYTDFSAKSPLVIDNGSGSLKVGLAGSEKPELVFQS